MRNTGAGEETILRFRGGWKRRMMDRERDRKRRPSLAYRPLQLNQRRGFVFARSLPARSWPSLLPCLNLAQLKIHQFMQTIGLSRSAADQIRNGSREKRVGDIPNIRNSSGRKYDDGPRKGAQRWYRRPWIRRRSTDLESSGMAPVTS